MRGSLTLRQRKRGGRIFRYDRVSTNTGVTNAFCCLTRKGYSQRPRAAYRRHPKKLVRAQRDHAGIGNVCPGRQGLGARTCFPFDRVCPDRGGCCLRIGTDQRQKSDAET